MEDCDATARAGTPTGWQNAPATADGVSWMVARAIAGYGAADATLREQIDCADLCHALGYADAARILYDMVFVRSGCSRSSIQARRLIAARTGLWADDCPAEQAPRLGADFALDAALAELRTLIACPPELPMLPLSPGDAGILGSHELPLPRPTMLHATRAINAAEVADLLARLCDSLQKGDIAPLTVALEDVRVAVLEQSGLGVSDHPDGSAIDLAARVALDQLRNFFLMHHDLCWAPFGSPALFAAAARLEDAALGQYFRNVGNLLRSPRDLFGLIELASRDTEYDPTRQQRWLVLLAAHLDRETLVMLTEELGDRGLTTALSGLLGAARRLPGDGTDIFTAIRDAALDNKEIDLAAAAQIGICRRETRQAPAWILLGEILGTGGNVRAAEAAFAEALRLAPLSTAPSERLEALEGGDFERFSVVCGVGSPPWRVARRAQNRNLPDYALVA